MPVVLKLSLNTVIVSLSIYPANLCPSLVCTLLNAGANTVCVLNPLNLSNASINCVYPVVVTNSFVEVLLPCILVFFTLNRRNVVASNNCLGSAVPRITLFGSLNTVTNFPGLASNIASVTANGYASLIFQAFSTGEPSLNFHPLLASCEFVVIAALKMSVELAAANISAGLSNSALASTGIRSDNPSLLYKLSLNK